MLGWHIIVLRQADKGLVPATFASPQGTRLAVWKSPLDGLNWIDQLVKQGKGRNLGGDGYPLRYTAPAASVIPIILDGPPLARKTWPIGIDDVMIDPKRWEGQTVVDRDEANKCRADEWLLIEVWDES